MAVTLCYTASCSSDSLGQIRENINQIFKLREKKKDRGAKYLHLLIILSNLTTESLNVKKDSLCNLAKKKSTTL